MDKQQLLHELKSALDAGTVHPDEIEVLLPHQAEPLQMHPPQTVITPETPPASVYEHAATASARDEPGNEVSRKLTAVEIMFYISGIILFSAIMTMLGENWDGSSSLIRISLSAGIGALLWIVAYILHRQPVQSEIRKGLENSLILTGALSVFVGAFITTNEAVGGFTEYNYIYTAITFAVLGAVHFGYDRLVRKELILLLGLFWSVMAFPSLMFALLQHSHVQPDVWSLIVIASAGLLSYSARVLAKIYPDRPNIDHVFDGLVTFVILAVMYGSTFLETGIIWLVALVAAIIGMFYLSIVRQNKNFLGNASLFLVISIITISFKYFSGAGAAVSLIIAAMGLLGTAVLASSINKKYFKKPAAISPPPAVPDPHNPPSL
jgi:MFS family permease